MHSKFLRSMLLVFVSIGYAWAQEPSSCSKLTNFKAENVEITKAAAITAGATRPFPGTRVALHLCLHIAESKV